MMQSEPLFTFLEYIILLFLLEWFPVKVGLRQGYVSVTLLKLDYVTLKLDYDRGVHEGFQPS